ncbi:hypothetical protein M9H77_23721 [Catharanthus roseus]|uniref:Uncharacterized protein n=1 Tax=Catharanthus roseus TaxID=4058 RepID=A0ACC0AWX5_CATRO|nr:hypothetical protein M9H77_23721 [Catharanthus roseus]
MMKGNENGQKQSKNEADGINEKDLPPKVGQPTVGDSCKKTPYIEVKNTRKPSSNWKRNQENRVCFGLQPPLQEYLIDDGKVRPTVCGKSLFPQCLLLLAPTGDGRATNWGLIGAIDYRYDIALLVHLSPPRPNLEEHVSKYNNSVDTRVKRMEAARSQTASFHNMEIQIELLAKMIIEKLPGNAPNNTITLHDVEEQVMKFPMFMDDENETAQEQEESTPQRFQEPLPNTSVLKESTKDEYLPENKSEFEEGEPEKENESLLEIQKSHIEERQEKKLETIKKNEKVNSLTNKTNFFLVKNSLCVQASRKQPKKNDEERRRLMKFKGNFESAKRKHHLYCGKSRISFSSTLALINLLSSFKE